MENKKKYIAILLAILAIIVVIISFFKKENIEVEKETKPIVVSNYSNFYTVNSCLYRAVTYAAAKETDNLLLLLNEEYIKENKITKSNVLEIFGEVSEGSTFVSEKMYYIKLNDSITRYYVKGYIESNSIQQDQSLSKANHNSIYFIVYLDSSNSIFSIEPYSGELFEKGDTYEK